MRSAIANEQKVKGVEELVNEFTATGNVGGYLSCFIAVVYFGTVYGLEKLGASTVWKPAVRGFLADYAYVVRSRPPLTIRTMLNSDPGCNSLLGWFRPLPGSTRSRTRQCGPYLSCVSSYAAAKLVDRLLASGCQVDIHSCSIRLSDNAAVLLRSCKYASLDHSE